MELIGVEKRYGPVCAVEGVDLDVADGEFVVLLGPSGCGKSTTLRMVAGLEEISAGELRVAGRVMNRVDPKDRGVAMVFQNYALYPHKTVAQNLGMALRMRGDARADIVARVAEVAEMLGLTPLLERKPAALSGGQRQRVAIGRAIARTPDVFLFDEPLSNLDAKLRVRTRGELQRLHERLGVTALYVTHDQVEAMTLADRIVVMSDGRIAQVGTPREVYERPADLFVAGFVGSPAMNLIEVVPDAHGLRAGAMTLPAVPGTPAGPFVVGVRPEHVSLLPAAEPGPAGAWRLTARVALTELLGADGLVTLAVEPPAGGSVPGGGSESLEFVARIDGGRLPPRGAALAAVVDPAHIHCFGAGSGARLR